MVFSPYVGHFLSCRCGKCTRIKNQRQVANLLYIRLIDFLLESHHIVVVIMEFAVANTTGAVLQFTTIWRITFTRDSTHALTPITHTDMFFESEKDVKTYMDKIPDDSKYWYKITEALAVRKARTGKPPLYFPLEKPIFFDS